MFAQTSTNALAAKVSLTCVVSNGAYRLHGRPKSRPDGMFARVDNGLTTVKRLRQTVPGFDRVTRNSKVSMIHACRWHTFRPVWYTSPFEFARFHRTRAIDTPSDRSVSRWPIRNNFRKLHGFPRRYPVKRNAQGNMDDVARFDRISGTRWVRRSEENRFVRIATLLQIEIRSFTIRRWICKWYFSRKFAKAWRLRRDIPIDTRWWEFGRRNFTVWDFFGDNFWKL